MVVTTSTTAALGTFDHTMSPLHHDGRTIPLASGRTIFDYADDVRVRVPTSCGRVGDCHECIVEIRRGLEGLSPPAQAESFLTGNYRLACQASIVDTTADIEFATLRRQPRILTSSTHRNVDLDPLTVRMGGDVVFDGQRIERYQNAIYGLAIDIGTTTVVMNLVDLETGLVAHTASFENPQKFGGSDVMNRIAYDAGPNRGELQQVMLSAINFEIGEVSRLLGIHRRRIYEAVVVANSTMRDIFFGLDVQSIGEKPYKSVTELEVEQGLRQSTALNVRAADLGLRIHPEANVYGGVLVGCHVGADVSADLLAIAIERQEDVVMLVDVGTNTEVVVGNRHRLMAASCPAGPAFEGGEITYGMPSYDGAVESVEISGDYVHCLTIGGIEPNGIYGSGLVDLLAQLKVNGKMDQLGVLADGSRGFLFASEQGMSLSRADISALAQAKSANYSGQFIALRRYGVQVEGVSKLFLAGAFANHINVENAVAIGFIAGFPAEKIAKVGNASLEGATLMLVSKRLRHEIEDLVKRIEHIELETTPDFFDIFVEGCMFKPMEAWA